MQEKAVKEPRGGFVFRVRMGEYEMEISGSREEVLKTIGDLPNLMTGVHGVFESLKPKPIATVTVKTDAAKDEAVGRKYPKISRTENCDEAILRILETDWGKWRPRTVDELREALKANGLDHLGRVFAGVLTGLVRKGKVRRWKTDAGYVYILAEEEVLT